MYRFVVLPGTPVGAEPNWFEEYALAQLTPTATARILNDPLTQYLSAMYWAFTTTTTVGYGDILPQNIYEMWFVICMEYGGLLVFSMAIASMTTILTNFNPQKKLHRERMAVINRYVRERGLTHQLQRRVRRFYEYYLERASVFDVPAMLDEVSQSLKNELCESMYRELADDLPFLQGRDASFLAMVCLRMRPFFALPGEYICRRGVIGLEVYWIRHGRVRMQWGPSSQQRAILSDGQHFGQEVLASTNLKMRADVQAIIYSDLLYLPTSVLDKVLEIYPSVLAELASGGRLGTVSESSLRKPAAEETLLGRLRALRDEGDAAEGASAVAPAAAPAASADGAEGSSTCGVEPDWPNATSMAALSPSLGAQTRLPPITSEHQGVVVPTPAVSVPPSPPASPAVESDERTTGTWHSHGGRPRPRRKSVANLMSGLILRKRAAAAFPRDRSSSFVAEEIQQEINEMVQGETRERAISIQRQSLTEGQSGPGCSVESPDVSPTVPRRQRDDDDADGARNSVLTSAVNEMYRAARRRSTMGVIDPLDEQARERAKLAKLHLFHPTSPCRTYWDVLLAVFVLYSILVVPLRIGFELQAPSDSFIFWFEVAIDFFFIVDILVNFRTSYARADGRMEKSYQNIAWRYARTWLPIDFTSSVPIDLILFVWEASTGSTDGQAKEIKITKVIKGLRLMRMMKLLRLLKITKYLKTAQEELQVNPAVVELLALGVKTIFLMHLAACAWNWCAVVFLPASMHDFSLDEINANMTLAEVRARRAMDTWLQYFASLDSEGLLTITEWPTPFESYSAAIYWAVTTMSTIGYGDIKSITNVERVVSIVTMLVGSVIFGIVVSGMQTLMEQINSVRHRAQAKLDNVKAMLKERDVPRELIRKTTQYYHHFLSECYDAETEQRILDELAPPLRTEVLLFLNADTVESIHFFRGQDSTFIVSVCKMLKACFFSPQDWIFKEGEVGLEMYFMQMGNVQMICYVNNQEVVLEAFSSGSYFGEIAILLDGLRREASARAASFCSMFSFTKAALSELLSMHPEVARSMQEEMEARLRKWRLRRAINTVRKMNKVSMLLKAAGKKAEQTSEGPAGANVDAPADAATSVATSTEGDTLASSTRPSQSFSVSNVLAAPVRGLVGRCGNSSQRIAPGSSRNSRSSAREREPPKRPSLSVACSNSNAIDEALEKQKALATKTSSTPKATEGRNMRTETAALASGNNSGRRLIRSNSDPESLRRHLPDDVPLGDQLRHLYSKDAVNQSSSTRSSEQ